MSNFLKPTGEDIGPPVLKEEGAGGLDFSQPPSLGDYDQLSDPEFLVPMAEALGEVHRPL